MNLGLGVSISQGVLEDRTGWNTGVGQNRTLAKGIINLGIGIRWLQDRPTGIDTRTGDRGSASESGSESGFGVMT